MEIKILEALCIKRAVYYSKKKNQLKQIQYFYNYYSTITVILKDEGWLFQKVSIQHFSAYLKCGIFKLQYQPAK